MSWKLSVVEPFPVFSRTIKFESTLNSDRTTSDTNVSVAADPSAYFMKGDIVKIGPSSDPSNIGSYEFQKVFTTTSGAITFPIGLTYNYLFGDSVSGVGSALASGLSTQKSGTYGTVVNQGLSTKQGTSGLPLDGFMGKMNAQFLSKTAGASGYYQLNFSPTPYLLSDTYYRAGIYYMTDGYTGSGSLLKAYENSAAAEKSSIAIGSAASWTKAEVGFITGSPVGRPQIGLYFPYGVAFTWFGVGLMYMTHASLSNGGFTYGFYTIPYNPQSVVGGILSRSSSVVLKNNQLASIGPLFQNEIREYRLVFNEVDEEFIRELEAFHHWQKLGYILMLESDITGERPVFGVFDFDVDYINWSDNLVGVNFTFSGV